MNQTLEILRQIDGGHAWVTSFGYSDAEGHQSCCIRPLVIGGLARIHDNRLCLTTRGRKMLDMLERSSAAQVEACDSHRPQSPMERLVHRSGWEDCEAYLREIGVLP